MPYATNNKVSKSAIDGGIVITNEQYKEGIAGVLAGKTITTYGGEFAVESIPASYSYDDETGEIIAASTAVLEVGGWAARDGGTLLPPPKTVNNETAVFKSGAWSIEKDYRGETWWRGYGDPVLVVDLGMPEGLTKAQPAKPEPSIDPADYPLTARQIRLGLKRHGFTMAQISAGIDTISDVDKREETRIYWDFSATIEWGHEVTQSMISRMKISQENAIAMWLVAKDY